MALRLHAVVPLEDQDTERTDGTSLVVFRDLAAITTDQAQFLPEKGGAGDSDIAAHRAVVDAAFHHGAVLPTPVGVVFRSSDVIVRWMELHYVALSDALQFVEDRVGARVHIERAEGKAEDREVGADLAAAAAEAYRVLRRRAIAGVPLRTEKVTGLVLTAALLIEREGWKEFVTSVQAQQEEHPRLRFQVTGPWAPYDFVRMQFGG
jgi:hypothetical protein